MEILSSIAKIDGVDDDDKQSSAASLAWSLSSTISSQDDSDPPVLPSSSLPSSTSTSSMSWEQLAPKEQEKLLLQWGKLRGRQGTRADETTEDRIVLAERLRRQLELILDSTNEEEDGKETLPVNRYAKYVNSLCNNEANF